MDKSILYIIRFLIGGRNSASLSSLVGYTANPSQFGKYRVVILPSPFFREDVYGTPASMPELPLREINSVPLLFGIPETEMIDGTLIVHADIIASAFFLLSRYEEIRRREVRDEHGRFPGKESLPYKAEFLHRPVVDEYGRLLRDWLRQTGVIIHEPEPRVRKIWLTHDVDAPFYCRTFRHALRETIKGKGLLRAIQLWIQPLEKDPYFTFPWLIERDAGVRKAVGDDRCTSVFFMKGGGRSRQDKPWYLLHSPGIRSLLSLCREKQVIIGLHSSYDAGKAPQLIASERDSLGKAAQQTIIHNRHHYLAAREPEDFNWLEKAGITDDFTMGYADTAGFRLGTCRPVRWINPLTKRLSSLVLHPLTAMDVALSESKYMGLDHECALSLCRELIRQTARMNGELVLLWHNDTVSDLSATPWLRQLYEELTDELKKV